MKYKVIDISEEDYGCEGIPEGSELMCSVLLESTEGTRKWVKIADSYLRENGIDIGSVVTYDQPASPGISHNISQSSSSVGSVISKA